MAKLQVRRGACSYNSELSGNRLSVLALRCLRPMTGALNFGKIKLNPRISQ